MYQKRPKKINRISESNEKTSFSISAVVADLVKDFNDPVWQMILHLRTVCSLVCAPALSMGQVAELSVEIHSYITLTIECLPDRKLIPKQEFLLHYPALIEIFGPLKHSSTLKFERKHGGFKKQIKHIPNFKSVTQTLAERHQLQQANIPVISGTLATSKKTMDYIPKDHNYTVNRAIMNCFVKEAKSTMYISKMVTFRGVQYAKDLSMYIGKNQRGNFILCKILNTSLGLYENYTDVCAAEVLSSFPYSSLLLPHPFLEVQIASIPVYLPEYAPFDADLQL